MTVTGIIDAIRKLVGLKHRGTAKIDAAVAEFEKTWNKAVQGVVHIQDTLELNAQSVQKAEQVYRATIAALTDEAAALKAEAERGLRIAERVAEFLS